jgi:ribosome recycling factor
LSYSGYKITPLLSTFFASFPAAQAATEIASRINAYNSDNPEEVYATATASGTTLTVSIRVSPRVTTTSVAVAITTSGISITSNSDGVLSDTPAPRLTNANAKKLLGIIDELCGCPCGKSDSEITDDSPSFFLQDEP